MQSRRYRDPFRALPALAAAAGLATLLLVAPEAAAQGSIQIQDTASTVDPSTKSKRRMGTPQLGASSPAKRQPLGFVDTLLQGPKLTTTPPEAPDWVRKSRPAAGAPAPTPRASGAPARPTLTPDEIRRREAALDAARLRHDRAAGRKSRPAQAAPTQANAGATAAAKPGCVMTCAEPIGVRRRR